MSYADRLKSNAPAKAAAKPAGDDSAGKPADGKDSAASNGELLTRSGY